MLSYARTLYEFQDFIYIGKYGENGFVEDYAATGGTFHGPDGFLAFYRDIYDHYYETFHYDAHAVLDAGSHVIVPVRARAKAKTGRTMENEHCLLFTVNDGLITEARLYADTAKGRDSIDGLQVYPSAAS